VSKPQRQQWPPISYATILQQCGNDTDKDVSHKNGGLKVGGKDDRLSLVVEGSKKSSIPIEEFMTWKIAHHILLVCATSLFRRMKVC
jgi:hypothetical protein